MDARPTQDVADAEPLTPIVVTIVVTSLATVMAVWIAFLVWLAFHAIFLTATTGGLLMQKSRTAAELADMIVQRVGLEGIFLAVKPDPYDGWRAYVVTAPQVVEMQLLVDKIAAQLHAERYRLRLADK
jgi:hypothetical protein